MNLGNISKAPELQIIAFGEKATAWIKEIGIKPPNPKKTGIQVFVGDILRNSYKEIPSEIFIGRYYPPPRRFFRYSINSILHL